jgi:arylsulfatase A-like enzyme
MKPNTNSKTAVVCGLFGSVLSCSSFSENPSEPPLKIPGGPSVETPEDTPDERNPYNVLFLMVDDLCDWTGYLGGHSQIRTPNLDSLASVGVRFSNAYTTVSLSNPSRAALFTGLLPRTTGIYNNKNDMATSPVVAAATLMPEHFHNNGYKTLCAGKVFHTKPEQTKWNSMWDDLSHVDGGYGPAVNKNKGGIVLNPDIVWTKWQVWDGPDSDFPDVVNADHVVKFLSQYHSKPFFAAVGMYRPHAPYTVPRRFYEMYDKQSVIVPELPADDLDDVSPYALTYAYPNFCDARSQLPQWKADGTWKDLVRGYMAAVTFADYNIGRILKALRQSEYADNTIIVLCGDNGFHHGEKQRFSKMSLWREANHVPLIICYPGGHQDCEVEDPVSLLDLYPTLCDLCDLPAVPGLEGNNITPLVENPDMSWDKPSVSNYLPGNYTVHYKNWNYLRYNDGSAELYDISTDEDELHNLVSDPQHADLIRHLSSFIPE